MGRAPRSPAVAERPLIRKPDQLSQGAHPRLFKIVIRKTAIGKFSPDSAGTGPNTIRNVGVGCQTEHDVKGVSVAWRSGCRNDVTTFSSFPRRDPRPMRLEPRSLVAFQTLLGQATQR
jgi:hypothetical protein